MSYIKTMRVHNLMEVKALIKESYSHGTELVFDKTTWLSHNETHICVSRVRDTEFELIVEDTQSLDGYRSVTMEIY